MKNILKLFLLVACLSVVQVINVYAIPVNDVSVDFKVENKVVNVGDNLVIEATIKGTNFSTTSFEIYQENKLIAQDKDMTITNHTTSKPVATWKIPSTLKFNVIFYIDVLVKDSAGVTLASMRKEASISTTQLPVTPPTDTTLPVTPAPTAPVTGQEVLTGYKVTLNNKEVVLSEAETLILHNGSLFTPIQGIINHMGYKSAYTPLDKTITISKENLSFTLKINDTNFSIGDKKYTLKIAPLEANGVAFFPIDDVGRALNYMTYIDKTSKTIAFLEVSTDPATLKKLDRTKLDNNEKLFLTNQISKLDLVLPNEFILSKNEWGAIIKDVVSERKISFKYTFLGDGTFTRDIGFKKANEWIYMPGDVGRFAIDPVTQALKLDFLASNGSNNIKSTETYNIAYSRVDSRLYYFDKATNKYLLFATELSKF